MYSYTDTSITLSVSSTDSCAGLAVPIVAGIIVAAVVGFLIVMALLIAFTPVGIPCRIWYRKNCGSKYSGGDGDDGGF